MNEEIIIAGALVSFAAILFLGSLLAFRYAELLTAKIALFRAEAANEQSRARRGKIVTVFTTHNHLNQETAEQFRRHFDEAVSEGKTVLLPPGMSAGTIEVQQ